MTLLPGSKSLRCGAATELGCRNALLVVFGRFTGPCPLSLLTNGIWCTSGQESSGHILQAHLAQSCFATKVRTQRERLGKTPGSACVPGEKDKEI